MLESSFITLAKHAAIRLSLLLSLLLALAACATSQSAPTARNENNPAGMSALAAPDRQLLLAEEAFLDGDLALAAERYDQAARLIERLAEREQSSRDEDGLDRALCLRRRTAYGLSLARLAQARDQNEVDSAMELWEAWTKAPAKGCADVDPRLVTPLLKRIEPQGGPALAGGGARGLSGQLPGQDLAMERLDGQFDVNERISRLRLQLEHCQQERQRLESEHVKELQKACQENSRQQNKAMELERENRTLREKQLGMAMEIDRLSKQIEALEALHMEMNRKKKVVE